MDHQTVRMPEDEVDGLRSERPRNDSLYPAEDREPPPPSVHEPAPSSRLPNLSPWANLKYDLPAGLVVFLVAVPLCLGIALASGAPALSGILAGIAGGLVIPLISKAPLSVSGPAAGLAAIVAAGIAKVGSFEVLAMAVVLAGVIQMVLGALKAGRIAHFVPSSVIQGMLTAIGLLLILKQIPHAVGYDKENFASVAFRANDSENTFSLFFHALSAFEPGAIIIALVSISVLVLWEKTRLKRLTFFPGPLAAVLLGIGLETLFRRISPTLDLEPKHLVQIPIGNGNGSLLSALRLPSFASLTHASTWVLAVTLAIVASLETLLNVEAVDKLDPYHRKSPPNRELLAQGVANIVSGMMGGLPVTSVVVRSTASLNAGSRTQMSAFAHGVLLLLAVLLAAPLLNRIPLACLAAILLVTGYKLTKPAIFRAAYRSGASYFVPFLATVIAILFTDLLKGTAIGLGIGVAFALRKVIEGAFDVQRNGKTVTIRILGNAHFFSRGRLVAELDHVPNGSKVVFEAVPGSFVDRDVLSVIGAFAKSARRRKIEVELHNISLEGAADLAH
ncbi:Sulfate permease [Minicystis rosea]|nr:Sulfate permease [Minicystis rosea]